MSDPYLGEIKIWSFAWAPRGWALCDGSILPATQNQALRALLGNTFGGDGSTSFALPNLCGRTPVGVGISPTEGLRYLNGNNGGAETVTLTQATVPPHIHSVVAYTGNGTVVPPGGNNIATVVSATPGSTTNFSTYMKPPSPWAPVQLAAESVTTTGDSAPHNNMQPFTVVNFTICTQGSFPPRN